MFGRVPGTLLYCRAAREHEKQKERPSGLTGVQSAERLLFVCCASRPEWFRVHCVEATSLTSEGYMFATASGTCSSPPSSSEACSAPKAGLVASTDGGSCHLWDWFAIV